MMDGLFETVSAFRAAIEEAVHAGEIKEMATFPRGCCSFASDLLQRYLFEHGVVTWYMSGRYGYEWNGESHAWLETEDGLVIDITGDQYKYKKLKFIDPVYVGPRKDGFHDKFVLDKPIAYQIVDDPFGRNRDIDRRYQSVICHLNK